MVYVIAGLAVVACCTACLCCFAKWCLPRVWRCVLLTLERLCGLLRCPARFTALFQPRGAADGESEAKEGAVTGEVAVASPDGSVFGSASGWVEHDVVRESFSRNVFMTEPEKHLQFDRWCFYRVELARVSLVLLETMPGPRLSKSECRGLPSTACSSVANFLLTLIQFRVHDLNINIYMPFICDIVTSFNFQQKQL